MNQHRFDAEAIARVVSSNENSELAYLNCVTFCAVTRMLTDGADRAELQVILNAIDGVVRAKQPRQLQFPVPLDCSTGTVIGQALSRISASGAIDNSKRILTGIVTSFAFVRDRTAVRNSIGFHPVLVLNDPVGSGLLSNDEQG